jgi:hypothetical protein
VLITEIIFNYWRFLFLPKQNNTAKYPHPPIPLKKITPSELKIRSS